MIDSVLHATLVKTLVGPGAMCHMSNGDAEALANDILEALKNTMSRAHAKRFTGFTRHDKSGPLGSCFYVYDRRKPRFSAMHMREHLLICTDVNMGKDIVRSLNAQDERRIYPTEEI